MHIFTQVSNYCQFLHIVIHHLFASITGRKVMSIEEGGISVCGGALLNFEVILL